MKRTALLLALLVAACAPDVDQYGSEPADSVADVGVDAGVEIGSKEQASLCSNCTWSPFQIQLGAIPMHTGPGGSTWGTYSASIPLATRSPWLIAQDTGLIQYDFIAGTVAIDSDLRGSNVQAFQFFGEDAGSVNGTVVRCPTQIYFTETAFQWWWGGTGANWTAPVGGTGNQPWFNVGGCGSGCVYPKYADKFNVNGGYLAFSAHAGSAVQPANDGSGQFRVRCKYTAWSFNLIRT